MPDPRMVAASIQLFASVLHGTLAQPDRMTASSQGVLISAMDAVQHPFGAEDRPADGIHAAGHFRPGEPESKTILPARCREK